jgi:tetratricopeptide (TPR) repeat protein
VDTGALATRLHTAKERNIPAVGEATFERTLDGGAPDAATFPLANALAQSDLSRADVEVLAAFDLVVIADEKCRFADPGVMRTAAELRAGGRSLGDVVQILRRARDLAPQGRRRITLTSDGQAVLNWDDGHTSTLEGQGVLPLDEGQASVDDLFEAAALTEADGDLDDAARLYDLAARADRADAIAPYNLGNIRLTQEAYDLASLAYQLALARDPKFVEARYNLAQALEAAGKPDAAAAELNRALALDPAHADAVFNLAQLEMKVGRMEAAKALYERYLALDPPADWAATARRAIQYCAAQLAG